MTGAYRKTKFKFTYEVDTVLLQLIYKHRQEIYHRGSTCKGWNQILEQFNRRVSANILQSRTLNNRFKALRKDINLRIKSRVLVGEELNENEKMLMYLNEYFSKKAGKVIEKEKRNGLLIGPEGEGEVEGDAEGDVERDVEGNAEVEAETRGKEQGQKGERKKRRRREKTPGFGQMMYMEYPYIDEMEREGGEEVGEEGKNGLVQPHQQQQQQQQQHQPNQQHHQHHQQHHQHHQQQHQQHQQHHQQHHTSFSSSTRSLVSSQGYYNILPSHSPPRIASPKIPFSALEIDKDDYRGTFDMYQSPKPQLDFNANLTSPQYAKFPKDVDQMAVVQSLQHAQLQQTQEIQDIKKEFYSFKYEIGTKLEQILESLNRPR